MKVRSRLYSLVRPGFPGLSKYSNPTQCVSDLTRDMRGQIESEKENRKARQKELEYIHTHTAGFSDAEVYQLWVDALELSQEKLESGVKIRNVMSVVWFIIGIVSIGYAIGVGRGLYYFGVTVAPLWMVVMAISITSVGLIIRGAKLRYQSWCIVNKELPSFFGWVLKIAHIRKSGGK
ncbi:hypothetical protein D3C80_301420 [compost metagenome]